LPDKPERRDRPFAAAARWVEERQRALLTTTQESVLARLSWRVTFGSTAMGILDDAIRDT
jgi:hypothetical protein